jgi:endogenous inhibitor of DNA gyrase (YacG/DUF329 family)
MTLVTCPTCKRTVEWSADNKWRPFCSERCKLIDFGAWASEKNAIAGDDNVNTENNPDSETSGSS